MRIIRKASITFLSIVVATAIILQSLIVFAPFIYKPEKADTILILGYALSDGIHPDEWLTSRLEKGLELYNKGYSDFIIVSGGKGPRDQVPVAKAMKTWLIKHGVPQEKIITEEKSHSTFENMIFSKEIIVSSKARSVIVVTNDFHLYRAMLMAKDQFEYCSGASASSNQFAKKVYSYLRETAAVLKYIFFKN